MSALSTRHLLGLTSCVFLAAFLLSHASELLFLRLGAMLG